MEYIGYIKQSKNNEITSRFVYDDEICVCCGNPSLPNDMLCKACRDKANEEKENE